MDNKENQSSLQTLIGVLWSRLFAILAIGAAVAIVFALVTVFLITPQYSSVAKFYVNNAADRGDSDGVSQQDIYASKSLAETSIVLIKNNTALMQEVIDASGVKCSVGALKGMITTGTYSGTEAFYVSVSAPSPKNAQKLALAFQEIVPVRIPEAIMGGVVTTFDTPALPTEQDSPNLVLNTIIGAFLGVAVSIVIFFLREVLDNTVYSEEDIKGLHGYPIVGVIPTITVDAPIDNKKGRRLRAAKADGGKGEVK